MIAKQSFRSTVTWLSTAKLGIAALILLVIIGLLYREWRQYRRANANATQSREIQDSVDKLLSGMLDAETGQRGFLLTGEDRYLEPYNRAIQTVPSEIASLTRLLSLRQNQSDNLIRLKDLTDQKLAELRRTIEIRKTQGATPALEVVLSDQGKQSMDEFRRVVSEVKRRENAALTDTSLDREAAAQTALLINDRWFSNPPFLLRCQAGANHEH